MKDLLNKINKLSFKEVDRLLSELKFIHKEKFNESYTTIEVVTGRGNISSTIEQETGYETYHQKVTQVYEGCVGTNVICVPKHLYTDELKKELLKKYEKF